MRRHDQLRERVCDVLNEADASAGRIVSGTDPDGETDAPRAELETAAGEARELVESTEPSALLEALGLATLPDGSEPDSIPAAVARGSPERVESLRRLLSLAKLSDERDGAALDEAVDHLRWTMGEPDESAAEAASDGADGADSDDEPVASESEAAAPDREDATAATDDTAERLRSALQSTFSAFGEDAEQLRDRLEAARSGTEADEEVDSEDSESVTETEEAAADPGRLGTDRDHGTATRGGARHSTMAPPPSKRADMRGLARHSTVPDRRR